MPVRNLRSGLTGFVSIAALMLSGCGGGGGGSAGAAASGTGSTGGSSSGGGTTGTTYVPGQYLAVSQFVAKCASPRSGTDPVTDVRYPDVQGTATDENNYLRSWTHQLYLWFDQVPDLDPSKLHVRMSIISRCSPSATTASKSWSIIPFHLCHRNP